MGGVKYSKILAKSTIYPIIMLTMHARLTLQLQADNIWPFKILLFLKVKYYAILLLILHHLTLCLLKIYSLDKISRKWITSDAEKLIIL